MKSHGARHFAREFAIRMLYSQEQNRKAGIEPETIYPAMWLGDDRLGITREVESFARELVEGISSRHETIDEYIRKHSKQWRIERMPLVDKSILRLAVYEMLCSDGLAAKVIINEAVELAKCYGDDQSHRFINGILDSVARETQNTAKQT